MRDQYHVRNLPAVSPFVRVPAWVQRQLEQDKQHFRHSSFNLGIQTFYRHSISETQAWRTHAQNLARRHPKRPLLSSPSQGPPLWLLYNSWSGELRHALAERSPRGGGGTPLQTAVSRRGVSLSMVNIASDVTKKISEYFLKRYLRGCDKTNDMVPITENIVPKCLRIKKGANICREMTLSEEANWNG